MEFLRSLLRRRLARAQVATSRGVGYIQVQLLGHGFIVQLVCLLSVGILDHVMFNLKYLFLTAECSAPLAPGARLPF